jgi:hypothetical protein
MKILVACEYSGIVRDAFRKIGHNAWSCDILPTDGDTAYHYQCDVKEVLNDNWDLMIAHPPCTYLANSGVRWLFSDETRWKKLESAIDFFKLLLNANIPKIAIENPIQYCYARKGIGIEYTQIIHPYMFGHPERKATCLWLKELEPLIPTNNVKEEMLKLPKKDAQKIHYLPPSDDRWKLRSKTFQGFANAMAEQWG